MAYRNRDYSRVCKFRANQRRAKERKRMAAGLAVIEDESADCFQPARSKPDCVIILRFPKAGESKSISLHRFGSEFLALGRVCKLSGFLRRLGVVIAGMTEPD